MHWLPRFFGFIKNLLLIVLLVPGKISNTTALILTDKRVISSSGLIRRKITTLPYNTIDMAKAKQGLLGGLLDYGALTIIGKDDVRLRFKGIAEPFFVQMQIEEAVEMATIGKKLSQIVMGKF